MTKVTSKIVDRYVSYYKGYIKFKRNFNYKEANAYLSILEILEEVLLNDCGITYDKLVDIRYSSINED